MNKFVAAISAFQVAFTISFGTILLWLFFGHAVWLVTKPSTMLGDRPFHRIVYDDDGYPIVRYDLSMANGHKVEFRNLSGKLVSKPKARFGSRAVYLEFVAPMRKYPIDAFAADEHLQRVRYLGEGGDPSEMWFLVHDGLPDGGCWFEAYSGTGETVYVGRNGESTLRPAPDARFSVSLEQFASHLHDLQTSRGDYFEFGSADRPRVVYLAAADHIYQISLERRQRTPVAATPVDIVAIKAQPRRTIQFQEMQLRGERSFGFNPEEWLIALRTTDKLILLDGNGGSRQETSIPEGFQSSTIRWMQLHNGETLIQAENIADQFDSTFDRGAFFDFTHDGLWTNRRDYQFVNSRADHSELSNSVISGIANPTPALTTIAWIVAFLTTPFTTLQTVFAVALSAVNGLFGFWLCRKH